VRRTIARLVHDSERASRPPGARAVTRWRRRLVYRTGAIEVDLEVGRSTIAGHVRLLGEINAGDASRCQARVTVDGPSGHLDCATDDVGQFRLDRLVAGDHRLTIGLADEAVEIPRVPLRPRFPLDHDDLVTALGLSVPPHAPAD
jgi:hypothetical protein